MFGFEDDLIYENNLLRRGIGLFNDESCTTIYPSVAKKATTPKTPACRTYVLKIDTPTGETIYHKILESEIELIIQQLNTILGKGE